MNIQKAAINIYSVPKDKEEQFLMWWHEIQPTILAGLGFIKGTLYRSLRSNAILQFVNVAIWQNSLYAV